MTRPVVAIMTAASIAAIATYPSRYELLWF